MFNMKKRNPTTDPSKYNTATEEELEKKIANTLAKRHYNLV